MKKLILLISLLPGFAMASDKCEVEWGKLYEESGELTNDELLKKWRSTKQKCSESWVYFYRESYLLFSSEKFDEARSIAAEAKKKFVDSSPFDFLLVLINKFSNTDSGNVFSKERLLEIDTSLDALKDKSIATYPEYQSEMAVSKLALGKVDEAIIHANRGLEKGDEWPLLRILALAYEAKKNYPLVRESIDRLATVSQDTYLKSPELLLLSARAYAATGRMDLTKIAIVQASELSPQSMEDPEIKKTVQFIRSKIASGEFKNP